MEALGHDARTYIDILACSHTHTHTHTHAHTMSLCSMYLCMFMYLSILYVFYTCACVHALQMYCLLANEDKLSLC